jgi:hypothetical protein
MKVTIEPYTTKPIYDHTDGINSHHIGRGNTKKLNIRKGYIMTELEQKIKCGIHNTKKEIEICEFVASVIDGYTGVFNKRFTTWLDKQLAVKFGTKTRFDEYRKQDLTWNNVYSGLNNPYKQDYPEFKLYWQGMQIIRGFNNEPAELRETSNEYTYVYSVTGTEKIKAQMLDIAQARKNSLARMLDTKKNASKLQANKIKLEKLIREHNDNVSWIASDELRIRR